MSSSLKKIKITCKYTDSLPIDQLKAFQGKLKTIDKEAFTKLKESILRYGFSFPIFIWNKNILDGHQRFYAVQRLIDEGYKLSDNALPVVWIEAKNAREAAEKLLLINSRYAKIDQQGFDIFIEDYDIKLEDIEIVLDIPEIDLGLTKAEGYEGLTDPDEIPEVEETPVTKMGDIWILGDHRLCCGDSTKIEDVVRLMDGQKADMVFTDPPYKLTGGGCKGEFVHGALSAENFINKSKTDLFDVPDFDDWLIHIKEILKNDSEIFIMSNNRNLNILINKLDNYKAKMHNILIMYKNTFTPHLWYAPRHEFVLYYYLGKAIKPLNKVQSSVFEVKMPVGEDKNHPTQKPVELLTSIFKNHSHKLIYEPFSGSGTTIIAAQQTGKKCYAMEIDPHYCDVAVKRWEDFTGEKATL